VISGITLDDSTDFFPTVVEQAKWNKRAACAAAVAALSQAAALCVEFY